MGTGIQSKPDAGISRLGKWLTNSRGFAGAAVPGVHGGCRALTAKLRSTADTVVKRLGMQEIRRRLWHMAPGLLPFVFSNIPHTDPVDRVWRTIFILCTTGVTIIGLRMRHTYRRRIDESCVGSALGIALTVLPFLVCLPAQPEIGFSVLTIIAFGDGTATLAGMLGGRSKLPWNPEKTWVGSLSFVAAGTLLTSLCYWDVAAPAVPYHVALACAAFATWLSAITESLPSRINDNFRVGVTAGLALAAAHGALVGWSVV